MPLFTKPLICPSRPRVAGGPGLDSGYALLLAMLAATVLLISLTAVLPSIYQEGRRERETELIFRGMQYARATALFHQQFQRYPTSVSELTNLTNGMRFLRKEFTDPMTPGGKWRFIHANAQGVLLDSKTQPPPMGGPGQQGAGQNTGGFGMSGSSSSSGSAFGQSGMNGSSFGQSGMSGSAFGQSGMGGSSFGQQGMGGGGFGQSTGSSFSDSSFGGSTSGGQGNSAFFGAGNQGGGTYIVGVASTSHKQSIRIWNRKTHYDEWEFLGVDLGIFGVATSIPGLPQGVGGQTNQGNQPSMFGQPPTGSPMNPGQNQGGPTPF